MRKDSRPLRGRTVVVTGAARGLGAALGRLDLPLGERAHPGHGDGRGRAVCRASYINPRVIELFEDGVTIRPALDALGASVGDPATRGAVEEAVRRLLIRGRP